VRHDTHEFELIKRIVHGLVQALVEFLVAVVRP